MSQASMYKTRIFLVADNTSNTAGRFLDLILKMGNILNLKLRRNEDPKSLESKELTPELDFSFVESKEIDRENFDPRDNSRWFTTRDDLWTSFVLCSSWEKISNSWGRNPEF